MNLPERISRHDLIYDKPAPTFFEGALLGNGGMGAVVTTRPDAVVVHFGHNNVWDIRIAEDHLGEIGDFESLFARLKEIPAEYDSLSEDAWYREYVAMTSENYGHPYPRPMPCGSLLLGFDRRRAEVLGHTLRIGNGLCEIRFLVEGHPVTLQIFADQEADRLWIAFGESDRPDLAASLFNRIKLMPDPKTPEELPRPRGTVDVPAGRLAFRVRLPFSRREEDWDAGDPRDRAFRLSVTVDSSTELAGIGTEIEARLAAKDGFVVRVALEEGPDAAVSEEPPPSVAPSKEACAEAFAAARSSWSEYWSRSSVALEDEFLERVWYRNLYFFHCSVKPDATCPGLFANWSYGNIGSEWHGDYHMNYNTQQPFWVAFSSNHADKHLAYVSMVEHVLPISRKWAKDYYGLRGAYFPHSAYPVEMNVMPYPVPHWGWEVCETPWTVQSLWWHYLYTMDLAFLEERAFVPMKEAALFMVDYLKRPDARGEAWGDDRYHIFPTVVPELYELTPGFKKNRDCIVDLTLTKFLFLAFEKACAELGRDEEEAELLAEVREVLRKLPDYPTAESRRGTVFVSVPGEDPEVVYNVPNGIATVFPGEDHGLHSSPEEYEIAVNSYLNHRNEGGNELVFYHMAGARLGVLDLERFKRQIAYCLLPNGTCTDKLLEAGGRYSDTTPFDYMSPMGVWFENFALPAVINECLMQSYNGIIRLFPNWPPDLRASFATLRAVGGFLVSAAAENGQARDVEIVSEAGTRLRIYNPWEGGAICRRGEREERLEGAIFELDTAKGETIRLTKV
ncbi:glycosyl hydrolase family 95 catalytic domain-containing protein [Paenibacillus arenilitoris]|uniref:Glycoside hydrolase N-terminal domain-containing protein n=1 Tax=Paenibacillus arenilitoris TaxID=2772299 RepID=A0A927CPY7_9BACL|nr:glycoside hydrolase N-terminal domain-containing protein [Paenibacillus arenilitoris]MBD2871377.1 glycoside hydrolase N-terminal domain-containing protein [Paenibacillus arenilitoris]